MKSNVSFILLSIVMIMVFVGCGSGDKGVPSMSDAGNEMLAGADSTDVRTVETEFRCWYLTPPSNFDTRSVCKAFRGSIKVDVAYNGRIVVYRHLSDMEYGHRVVVYGYKIGEEYLGIEGKRVVDVERITQEDDAFAVRDLVAKANEVDLRIVYL